MYYISASAGENGFYSPGLVEHCVNIRFVDALQFMCTCIMLNSDLAGYRTTWENQTLFPVVAHLRVSRTAP